MPLTRSLWINGLSFHLAGIGKGGVRRGAHEDKHGLAIVHFSNDSKPWQWANRHAFKHEYRHYRLKTPWREYRAENIPSLPERLLRHCARLILPSTIRGWLRARLGRRLA